MKFSPPEPQLSSDLGHKEPATPRLYGTFFKFLPILLLGTAGLGWVVMVRAALSDPGFAIEPDYYKKAGSIDQDKARQRASQELGVSAQVESFYILAGDRAELRVMLKDRDGEPLQALDVRAVVFFNGRANERHMVRLSSAGAGLYVALIERARPGLWEIQLKARAAQGEHEETFRKDLLPYKGRS